MTAGFNARHWTLIVTQLMLAVAAFGLLAISPPSSGRLLIVPMTDHARSQLAAIALAHGAAMVERGPLPGSLVVAGDRATLAAPLLAAHILLFAAPVAGCGGAR